MDEEQALRGALRSGDYVTERTAWIRAQREMTELKLAQARGELAPTALVGAALAAVAAAVKQAVFAQPSAVAPRCVGKAAEEIRVILYEALREALEPFNEEHLERIILAACEGAERAAGAGAEGSAKVHGKRVGRRRKKAQQGVKRKPGGVAH